MEVERSGERVMRWQEDGIYLNMKTLKLILMPCFLPSNVSGFLFAVSFLIQVPVL